MLKIGLTGNIGSGKTTVAKVFEVLSVPVFYADEAARTVMLNDEELIAGVTQEFGTEAYFDDGSLNRKHIAGIVFNDAERLQKLNALVHPATFRAFDRWVEQFDNDVPYVIKEAAILFESGSYKLCDKSIIVTAPLETRLQRVMQRDNISHEEAANRNARQMPEEEKIKLADYTINNDGTQLVIPQVLALHQTILSLVKG
ncbi:dephospho-CoA kinase [Mucilaginibacter limnophilus]|uniref:Dephospho-CoA kinase n=1 Tax=Mucilaginibacter limnophilus TaxID=1932778 RepID=A0A437MFM9_9SPHI|nr:dephospho-CoA kinase [Mucilaginibacter limnophilus]RVT96441.1 dephospho-CoA kinase [Mucilaginibacter limnophilus]